MSCYYCPYDCSGELTSVIGTNMFMNHLGTAEGKKARTDAACDDVALFGWALFRGCFGNIFVYAQIANPPPPPPKISFQARYLVGHIAAQTRNVRKRTVWHLPWHLCKRLAI